VLCRVQIPPLRFLSPEAFSVRAIAVGLEPSSRSASIRSSTGYTEGCGTRHAREPPELRKGPEHAQHTEEVLLELGLEWDRIVELKQLGAIN